jgi:pilus assembly protein CpaC
MILSQTNSPPPRKRFLGASASALIAAATLALMALPAAMTPVAQASDLDFTEQEDGNFLRIGLGKSAVIKLPAAAKDVIVGDPTIVDVVLRNRNTAYLFARSPGQTNVFFFDAEGNQILNVDLESSVDSKAIKKLIDRTIPGNAIQVDSTGKSIVLKGTAANAQESKLAEDLVTRSFSQSQCDCQVVNAIALAEGDQVMLKVRVVELKRTVMKQLGINMSTNFSVGAFDFGFASVPVPNSQTFNGIGTGTFSNDGFSADIELRALEQEGLATTLAEPTLTAISGAQARFHAGGEFPFTVCEPTDRGRVCTVQFRPFGVSLDFTPTVLSEGRINLAIRTEVSELSQISNGGIPAIDTRNATTSVEIPSGGSMMLAGLIKDVTAQDLSGTPGLRKLPVIGALFNSRAYQKNQSEMVVIVTPYVVNPSHEKKLVTPTDGFNPATDRQAILFGRLNKVYGTPGKHPNGVYHGKVGYIIE